MEFIRDLPSRTPMPSRMPPSRTPSTAVNVEVIDLTSPSPPPRPSPVDVSLIINDIMEAHRQDIVFYEKTLDAIVSHYEDEKRSKEPRTEDHVKWIPRKTRPGKNACEKGGKKGGKKGEGNVNVATSSSTIEAYSSSWIVEAYSSSWTIEAYRFVKNLEGREMVGDDRHHEGSYE